VHTLLVRDAHPEDRDHLLQRHPLILECPSTLLWKHRAHRTSASSHSPARTAGRRPPPSSVARTSSRPSPCRTVSGASPSPALCSSRASWKPTASPSSAILRSASSGFFVSDVTQTQAEAGVIASNLINPHPPDFGLRTTTETTQDEAYKTRRRNFRLLCELFRCVSPGVRTLAVVLQDDWFMSLFVRGGPMAELPALEELSIACTEHRHSSSYR
jgi:hypothetical protein